MYVPYLKLDNRALRHTVCISKTINNTPQNQHTQVYARACECMRLRVVEIEGFVRSIYELTDALSWDMVQPRKRFRSSFSKTSDEQATRRANAKQAWKQQQATATKISTNKNEETERARGSEKGGNKATHLSLTVGIISSQHIQQNRAQVFPEMAQAMEKVKQRNEWNKNDYLILKWPQHSPQTMEW